MNSGNAPVFWRDARIPHVELRKVEDGRQVCYAPHSHTQWSIGAITEGKSTFQYRSDHYEVSAGDLVLVNPEWVHACNPIDNQSWAYLMLYVDVDWLTDLRFEAGLLPTRRWQDISTAKLSDPQWFQHYYRMAACLLDPQSDLLEKQTKVVEFLENLMRELNARPFVHEPKAPDALEALAHYINNHRSEDVSLDTLCEISGYSEGHLIRAFRQYFGLTPHAFLINRRIQLGQYELKNGAPIASAAMNAGFADQSHFQRTFKRLTAATPNQYRQPSLGHKV